MSERSPEFPHRVRGALFGTAVGDALGWPLENRSRRVGGIKAVRPRFEFSDWERRDGGGYAPHIEPIPAGTYSDDTQLTLAVARSRMRGPQWWAHLVEFELPFWLVYERGGGGATKRAAQKWDRGRRPWEPRNEREAQSYFNAGGNGAAMRIGPHVFVERGDSFDELGDAVVADGITTHGHPQALVGARMQAFALWLAVWRQAPVGYGEFVEEMIARKDVWGAMPTSETWSKDWVAAANAVVGDVRREWKKVVAETVDRLRICRGAIGHGSLAVDKETLEQLGAFDSRINGAGTVAAVAALFLASRYASRPEQGVVSAAFAKGADTDTIASMTGALLGAINGSDWLGPLRRTVQDSRYLEQVSHDVMGPNSAPSVGRPWRYADRRGLLDHLRNIRPPARVDLPTIGTCTLQSNQQYETRAQSEIRAWQLQSEDGITLYIKDIRQNRQTATPASSPASDRKGKKRPRVGLILQVDDLNASGRFYSELVGLELSKQAADYVSFAGMLALESRETPSKSQLEFPTDNGALLNTDMTITVYVDNGALAAKRDQLNAAKVPVSDVISRRGRRAFRCADPDGNVVEFREKT